MKISVVIPAYNREYTLPRALESVLNQIHPAQQIIVVDDGSSDDTGKTVKEKFPEVEYFYQDNRGVSAARNSGIRLATNEWIAFLDSDDEWLPDKLLLQIKQLQQNPEYRICHSDEIWIRRGKRVNPMKKHTKYGGYIFLKCLPLCIISPSAVLIHQSVFEQYGLFDENLPACEDYDLWLRICAFEPVLYVEKKLIIKYGGHDDQLSHKHWGMDRFRITALEKIIGDNNLKKEYKSAAEKMLRKKMKLFIAGAEKRNKNDALVQRMRLRLLQLESEKSY